MTARLTAAQVAERWQCSEEHVTRLARRKQLRALKSGRIWRFALADIEAYERAHTSEPEAGGGTRSERQGRGTTARPAVALDGPYDAVVKGPVPWRSEVVL